jgi:hypothetical protein
LRIKAERLRNLITKCRIDPRCAGEESRAHHGDEVGTCNSRSDEEDRKGEWAHAEQDYQRERSEHDAEKHRLPIVELGMGGPSRIIEMHSRRSREDDVKEKPTVVKDRDNGEHPFGNFYDRLSDFSSMSKWRVCVST